MKNIAQDAETKKGHNKNSSNTNDSHMVTSVTIESSTVAPLNSAKPLVKVPLLLSTRKCEKSTDKDDLQSLKNIFKILLLVRQQDKKDEGKRQICDREEDRKQKRGKETAPNSLLHW